MNAVTTNRLRSLRAAAVCRDPIHRVQQYATDYEYDADGNLMRRTRTSNQPADDCVMELE